MLTHKKARNIIWIGFAAIAIAVLLEWLLGANNAASLVALGLFLAGVALAIVGITWFIMHPMKRKA